MNNNRNGYGFNIQDNEELREYLAEHTTNASKSCTLIWFADQETGETKLWTGEVKDPYSLRYQVTEELDQCNITLISFLNHKTVFSKKIKNLTKVIIMHAATLEDYLPRFDENGKPLNHDQYVIVNGTCSLRQGNGYYYEHEYALGEPFYCLRYWSTETQTVTNMTSITVSELNDEGTWEQKTYTQDETNLYYILKRMLQITGYKTSVEDCSLDTLISIQDKTLLENACKGINDNFMSSNAYQFCVKLAKYIDRLPVLYFNPNYEVQDSSNNLDESKKEYLLFFEQKETGNVYTEDEVFTDISGFCECELATKDAGTVVVDAQNLVSATPIWYPGYGYFCGATGERGKLELTEDDYVSIKLPTAIDKVLNVKVFISYTNSNEVIVNKIIDVPVLEYQEWLNIAEAKERKKYLYYRKYGKVIEMNHSDYKTYGPPLISLVDAGNTEYFYSVQYIPCMDARIKMPTTNKLETSITQIDSSLDSKAYGTYLTNYAKENCNTDYSLSKTYFDFDKILKPGDSVEMKNGGRLVISSTDITRKNNSYFAIYVLNAYRVKRSSQIYASNKIDNKIINKESAMQRFINMAEKTIKVGLNFEQTNKELNLNYIKDTKILVDCYLGTYPELGYYPNIAFTKFDYEDGTSKYFSFNINKCQSGKSIIYNINTEDSMILYGGGLLLDEDMKKVDAENTYYKFTDSFGKIKKSTFYISDFKEGYTNLVKIFFTNNEEVVSDYVKKFIKTYPSITQFEYNEKESTSPIKINDLILMKDTNEILNISFQINFQEEDSNTILFEKFVELNSLISNESIEESSGDTIKYLVLMAVNKVNRIDDNREDLFCSDLKYLFIDKISTELVADNCIKIECSSNRVIPKDSQVILCQIISEVGDEIFVDPSNSGIIGKPKHIYPLIAKTMRTNEYETTDKAKEFYLEFSS